MSDDLYLFAFFWFGVLVCRTAACLTVGKKKSEGFVLGPLRSFACMREDFTRQRYEKVLESWALLETHTAEALCLVVNALLALGRADDIGIFVSKTSANLPSLVSGLHQVVAAVAVPACEVRRAHILLALRDLDLRARDVLDAAAVKELLLAFAKFNDEARVEGLLVDLVDERTPEFLGKIVRSFLASQNLDAALGYLQQVLAEPSSIECPPHALILDVVKASTEAELNEDSAVTDVRPKAWEALDALQEFKITKDASQLFLEWSSRQTPVDVAMATRIEQFLRAAGTLPVEAYDALVRVHASSAGDDSKALVIFDEFTQSATPTEDSLVGMISSCVEARNGVFAEHILGWAITAERCTLPVFSATLKVLAASKQAERICAIYEQIAEKKLLTLDETLIEQISDCAVQVGRLDLARNMPKVVKKSTQSNISQMRACASEGDVHQVLELLQVLQQDGEVDTATFNSALDCCVSCGNADAVKTVLKDMRSSGHMDVASYNILLKQCSSDGAAPQAAKKVLEEMRERGLEPTTATYNSLLSCAMTAGDFTAVWQTVEDLESAGQSADIYTLSILFKGYKRERRTMDSGSIDMALNLIKKHSVKMDENLVNVALEACLSTRDIACIKKALDTIWDSAWVVPKTASLHTYGNLIKACGQTRDLAGAWQLWTEVTEKGMEPSEQLYGQMLDVLVSNDCLEDARTLFQEMKKTHSTTQNSSGFAVAYAMIIRGFAQKKDCVMAMKCYEEMKTAGTKASLVVVNTLLDACSRVGDMRSASIVFADMNDMACEPDLITYSTLIKGHCISEDLEQALQLFAAMQEKGIRPDAIVFNSLLDGCAKKQVPGLCEQLIKDMVAAGIAPSNHSASILIKLYGRCKDLDAAFRVINEMPKKYSFRANNAVYTCLMSACVSNGALEKALELRKRMVDEGVYPDERTYSTLLRGSLRAQSIEQCSMLVSAALDQCRGQRVRSLLEEDLVGVCSF
jgi:pentatricopeptide repeat protein